MKTTDVTPLSLRAGALLKNRQIRITGKFFYSSFIVRRIHEDEDTGTISIEARNFLDHSVNVSRKTFETLVFEGKATDELTNFHLVMV